MGKPLGENIVMDREKYWRKTSKKVFDYLRLLGLNPIDIYLVGSSERKKGEGVTLASDIDSVILIKDKLSLDSLRNARLRIHKCLLESGDASLYHFKLFNEEEVQLLGRYDGFRLFEYQRGSTSMLCTRNIISYSPLLNDRNFCNSIFIQIVYEFLKDNINVSLDGIIKYKIKERIERNKEILRIAGKSTNVSKCNAMKFCRNRDELFAFFTDIINKSILRPKSMLWFMQQYFKRFRHEYINKYYAYMDGIQRRLGGENIRNNKY